MKGSKLCCSTIQNNIFGGMERFYHWYGQKVAKYPGWVILGCLIFAGLTSLGFLLLESETEQSNLWVPEDSDFKKNTEWLSKTFPSNIRAQQIMLVAEKGKNILTKPNLELLNDIMKNISTLR